MSYIYLSSPYSHPETEVMWSRYDAVVKCTAQLLITRQWVYSPIVHCHVIAAEFNLPTDYEYWTAYNRAMLVPAHTLMILAIEGWDTSRGVADETIIAHAMGKPIKFIGPNGLVLEGRA